MICDFPLCKYPALSTSDFCFSHNRHFGTPKPAKKIKPIAPLSKKRVKMQVEYRKIVKAAIEKDNRCTVKSPVCSGFAQGFNHLQKRSPANIILNENLELSCNPCNLFIEENTEWAKVNGHLISRFKK